MNVKAHGIGVFNNGSLLVNETILFYVSMPFWLVWSDTNPVLKDMQNSYLV